MINMEAISTDLSKVVSDLVGEHLSKVKGPSNSLKPAVFVAKRKPPKPSYPYAVCQHVGIIPIGSRETYKSYDELGNPITSFISMVRIAVGFYGGVGDNVEGISEEFRKRMFTPQGNSLMSLYMNGANLRGIGEPIFTDGLLETDFEEFSRLTVDFYISEDLTNSNSYIIESIEVEGNVSEDLENKEYLMTVEVDGSSL